MRYDPVVALDIGATKIACVIGSPTGEAGRFEIQGSSIVPFESALESTADPILIARTLERALEATGVAGELRQAILAVSHPGVRSETVYTAIALGDEPVPVKARDLKRLRDSALNQVISLDHDLLSVSALGFSGQGFDQVRDPIGLPTMRLRGGFHVVSLPIAARRSIVQAAESIGLDIKQLTYSLEACMAGLAQPDTSAQRVFVIDVGGTSTNLGLFLDHVLCDSHCVAWGGSVLAKRLATSTRVTLEQANNWVLEGTACPRADAVEFMMNQWERLGAEIKGFIEGHPLPDLAYVCGRAGLIDGFAEWLERSTGMLVELGRSSQTQRYGEMARQIALSPVIGLLNQHYRSLQLNAPEPDHVVAKILHRTKSVLTEYF